ncbi:MAG: hypothetical protein M1832_004653 [Thelocarpon impressellum]|nr:MAG: hypothetical protein M1832_004653 [Thelocarpon impressellum]
MDGYRRRLGLDGRALPVRVVISYMADYLIIAALIGGFAILDNAEPFHQHFSLRNYTLQYPYAVKERVPVPLLAFVVGVIPMAIIVAYTLFIDGMFSHAGRGGRRIFNARYGWAERLWELNCGVLGLWLAVGMAITATQALKTATGKPRPDLVDRCQPREGSADPLPFGLSNITICTQTDKSVLKDGFRSFPSGHSSTAFAGLYYLSLYLAAKLHVLDKRGEVWKTFLVLLPTLGAALIADSRIMDARHHPFDVLSGSLLGIVSAWVAYRQYFPPITEPWKKGRAYPIRSWGTTPDGPDGKEPLRAGATTSAAADEERAYGAGSTDPSAFRKRGHGGSRSTTPPQTSSGRSRTLRDGYWSDEERQGAVEMQPRPPSQYRGEDALPPAPRYDLQDTAYRPQQGAPRVPMPAVTSGPH